MSEIMRNPPSQTAVNSMFSLFDLVVGVASGLSVVEAAALAGCSPTAAEAVMSSDAFKAKVHEYKAQVN